MLVLAIAMSTCVGFTAKQVCWLRIDYATMPADDAVLTRWLESQPAVTKASIHRDQNALVIGYEVPWWASFVDVIEQSVASGYGGRGSFAGGVPHQLVVTGSGVMDPACRRRMTAAVVGELHGVVNVNGGDCATVPNAFCAVANAV
ncbi:MAG TPA: hypothetical protein VK348_09045 [Planctomycetota bacterium]|nr:hypothetical protein [Planctomycetota bacterium]